jgi:hypothetical protein
MSNQFTDTARSIVEHGLINKGLMKPARVWHIDPVTRKRTLLEDNTQHYLDEQNTNHAAAVKRAKRQKTTTL